MKKIILYTLMAGAMLFGTATQVSAGPLASLVHNANYLRATSNALNYQASKLEAKIRYYQAQGINPVYLKYKASKYRKDAKHYALKSNVVAKAAFDRGYHRYQHSHIN